jgi:hypothetical protein
MAVGGSRPVDVVGGETVEVHTTGSLKLERLTVSNSPWAWQLEILDDDGSFMAGCKLTVDGLRVVRDRISRAIVVEQGRRLAP